jgi:hypothetical protein
VGMAEANIRSMGRSLEDLVRIRKLQRIAASKMQAKAARKA